MAYASFKTRIGDLTGFASTDDTALRGDRVLTLVVGGT